MVDYVMYKMYNTQTRMIWYVTNPRLSKQTKQTSIGIVDIATDRVSSVY